eukprot:Skav200722  [mRNA]  locus=scaffold1362:15824:18340:+ [translate_table: standard]
MFVVGCQTAYVHKGTSCQALDTLHFVVKERPANLDHIRAFLGKSYLGEIKSGAKVCWASFPGKFAAAWDTLIQQQHEDSVACVFLDDPGSGLGRHHVPDETSDLFHHFADPENPGRCLCAQLYGSEDYKKFQYLMVKDPCEDQEEREMLAQRARAMNAHLVFGTPSDEDEKKAKTLWAARKNQAAWGCEWFYLWWNQVKAAVEDGQRLKVVYFPGEVGKGKVAWHKLPLANLWDGQGCGGSQKGEIAMLDRMNEQEPGEKWQYEEVDVCQFLQTQFQVGDTVDAKEEDRFCRVKICKVIPPDKPGDELKWEVECVNAGTPKMFQTNCVRRTTDFFQKLLRESGKDALSKMLKDVLGLEVLDICEERLNNGTPCLQVRLDLQKSIKNAQMLRDVVLSEDVIMNFNEELANLPHDTTELALDKTQFLEDYSRSLMTFSRLTPHQRQKLKEVSEHPDQDIHLTAPAGAGKTFVALRYVLRKLKPSASGNVIYISPSRSLIFYFVQWLSTHVSDHAVLKRMFAMQKPYKEFMSVSVQDHRIVLQGLQAQPTDTVLAVFDEAHETFRMDSSLFGRVAAKQKMILSDISQSSALNINYPDLSEVRNVALTEVVRSTKRVVLGAGGFGLQASADITCNGTTGPPLKTFLFERSEAEAETFSEKYFERFAQKTLEALRDLVQTYGCIRFEQHVAMIVPNEKFYTSFKFCLEQCLKNDFSPRCQIISFEDSLAYLPGTNHRNVQDDYFILDWDENAKGLEKLFVLCIGLDSPINKDEGSNNFKRAQLYHAMTRAQLQVIVVDCLVPNGWLEFLATLELKKEDFEESTDKYEVRKEAAQKIVDTQLAV